MNALSFFDSFRIASESPKQVIAETTLTGDPRARTTDPQARITLSKPEFPILRGATGDGRLARPAGRGAPFSTETTNFGRGCGRTRCGSSTVASSNQLSVSPSVSPHS